jgi:HemK-like putative methylase
MSIARLDPKDIELLRRDKYNGRADADMHIDLERLAQGEPLAYVIGWIPFLGATINLDSKPLIPRPETEQWTAELIEHLKYRFGEKPFDLLDLCAGSGAIGIAVLKHIPNATVWFGELFPEHAAQITANITANSIDIACAHVIASDLFESIPHDMLFDIIATNPPYIPSDRTLDPSVTAFEPSDALYSGVEGLNLIRRIATESSAHLLPDGELWMECDISNIHEAAALLEKNHFTETTIHVDQYGRERFIVGRCK